MGKSWRLFNFQDQPLDIEVKNNGDTYIGGWFGGDKLIWQTDTLFSFGGGDIFLVKFNTEGDLIWLKQAGGNPSDDVDEITDIDLQNEDIFVLVILPILVTLILFC